MPDHSTFSKNRYGRFRDSELPRHLFKMTVVRRIEEGLVSGRHMAIDDSLIEADANKQNSTPKEEWDASTKTMLRRVNACDIAKIRQYDISMKLRKKVEMLFAHLKRILGLGRLRL